MRRGMARLALRARGGCCRLSKTDVGLPVVDAQELRGRRPPAAAGSVHARNGCPSILPVDLAALAGDGPVVGAARARTGGARLAVHLHRVVVFAQLADDAAAVAPAAEHEHVAGRDVACPASGSNDSPSPYSSILMSPVRGSSTSRPARPPRRAGSVRAATAGGCGPRRRSACRPSIRYLPPEVSSQPGPSSARSKSSVNGSVMAGVFALQPPSMDNEARAASTRPETAVSATAR